MLSMAEQIKKQQKEQLDELIEWCGDMSNTARLLGVTPQSVAQWVQRGRISATMAAEAEKQTRGAVKKKGLRPDVIDWRV